MSRNTPVRVPRSEFAAVWNDPTVTTDQIAARFGMHRSYVSEYGRKIGLPPRKTGTKPKICEATFTRMWMAGIATRDMALALGMCRTHSTYMARRLGLPKRQRFSKSISLDDYRAAQLREAMAASAKETHAALRLAEMVDGQRHPGSIIGKRAA